MKVMTFNLRVENGNDGINCFENRKEKIVFVIKRENPDLIGLQEVNDRMLDFLSERLPEYVFLGHGRNEDYSGEGTPLAYRKNRFCLHFFREEWLSPEPDTAGSRFQGIGQSNCPRVLVGARLYDRKSRKLFSAFNVHLDHHKGIVQTLECTRILERIRATGLPYVLTGDFNVTPDSEAIALLLSDSGTPKMTDATAKIPGSFHSFGKQRENPLKIDYIFTDFPVNPDASYAVPDDDACGYFYSDHYALCAFPDSENDKTEKESD